MLKRYLSQSNFVCFLESYESNIVEPACDSADGLHSWTWMCTYIDVWGLMHYPKNNLNLRIKTEPIKVIADVTVNICKQKPDIQHIPLHLLQL